MHVQELLRRIESGTIPKVVVVAGGEQFFVDRAVSALRKAVVGDGPSGFNEDVFEGKAALAVRIIDAARTLPMLASLRLVLVRGVDAIAAAELDKLADYLEAPSPDASPWVLCDRERVLQILDNLIGNALKFTPESGTVTVKLESRARDVEVSVIDTGCGIAPEHLPHLFDRYWQVRSGDPYDARRGVGLGLFITKGLVEAQGGAVAVRSTVGQGSEFVVRLPVSTAEESAAPAAPPSINGDQRATKRRILIVDDNQDAAKMLALLLDLSGHTTELAHDGLAAVSAAEAFRPDLVLLDLGLPKLSGLDAARHIRQQPWGANMVLVALTGWGQEEDRRRTAEAGFDGHLVKPVDPAALAQLLNSLNRAKVPVTAS